MRKQSGKIYFREASRSPCKPAQMENQPPNEITTLRRDKNLTTHFVGVNSRQNSLMRGGSGQASFGESQFSSQTRRSYSSIHSSASAVSEAQNDQSMSLCGQEAGKSSSQGLNESSFLHESNFADSLAIYENPQLKKSQIIAKLSHLNNIFKEIKNLRQEKFDREILKQINDGEKDLIEIQRELFRNC